MEYFSLRGIINGTINLEILNITVFRRSVINYAL